MDRPNILFLLSDEHAFRHMGHRGTEAGGEPVDTPTFDRLAARGTVFSDAYCQMPLCTPSRMTMLSGREVRNCGAWSNSSALRAEIPTLPGALRDSGYTTCLVGKMHLYGTQQFVGFEHRPYGDLLGRCGHQDEPPAHPKRSSLRMRTESAGVSDIPESLLQDAVVAQETVTFLREQQAAEPEKPWFLCASFSRPHFPLTAPKRWIDRYWPEGVTEPPVGASGDAYDHPMSVGMREGFQVDAIDHAEQQRARAGYFACVSYLDEVLGDLLLRLEADGLLENTIIVYTSDHGEMAGEHGTWWKNGWYEACTHVPLIISTPEQRSGQHLAHSCPAPVGLIDLMPTLLDLAGVTTPSGVDGYSLAETVSAGVAAPLHPVFTDSLTPRWGAGTEFRSVRLRHYKYVRFRDAAPLMFDLKADPGEQRNLLQHGELDVEAEAARAEMAAFAESSIDFDAAEQERTERDGDLQEQYASPCEHEAGNLYVTPSGAVIDSDPPVYHQTKVADSLTDIVGPDWQTQNPTPGE